MLTVSYVSCINAVVVVTSMVTFAGDISLASSSVSSPRERTGDEATFCYADELTLLAPSADG